MNGIMLAQRPVNRERIGEERRLETLDIKVEGGLAKSLLLIVGLSDLWAHRCLIPSLLARTRNETPGLLGRFPRSPKKSYANYRASGKKSTAAVFPFRFFMTEG